MANLVTIFELRGLLCVIRSPYSCLFAFVIDRRFSFSFSSCRVNLSKVERLSQQGDGVAAGT